MASGGEISASGYWPKAANPALQKKPAKAGFFMRAAKALVTGSSTVHPRMQEQVQLL